MVVDEKPIHNEEEATDLLFRALADPIRRDILRRAEGPALGLGSGPRTPDQRDGDAEARRRAGAGRTGEQARVGRESIVQTETDALARAHAALDRLEADWRGRIQRMEQILETDKGDS
jgi:hypothetical protein